jgi:hypothetical protein
MSALRFTGRVSRDADPEGTATGLRIFSQHSDALSERVSPAEADAKRLASFARYQLANPESTASSLAFSVAALNGLTM